jgi:tetratricopeptide (TPR) repeat protein
MAGYLPQALKEYEKAIALAPGMAMFHSNYGITLAKLGYYQKGLEQLRMAVQLDPTSTKYINNLGLVLFMKGSIDNASICFKTALGMDPRDDQAYGGLASVLQVKHEEAKALTTIAKAIALDPYNPAYRWQKCQILLDLGRTREAKAAFRDAVHLDPSADRISGLAWTMHLRDQDDVAIWALWQALKTRPGDATIEVRLAWILATTQDASLRNAPEAMRLATNVMRSQGLRSPELLDVLAVAQAGAGQYSAAQATLQEAIAKAADHPQDYRAMLQAQLAAFQKGQLWLDRPATSNLASKKPNGA